MNKITIKTDTNIKSIVDSAIYCSYKYNRDRSPDITPEQWVKIFPRALEYEELYKLEKEMEGR